MSARRLSSGGRIDRSQTLRFTWDGRTMGGHAGDSLASALMAGGERVIGRSFKYHRPRGVMSAGVEESGALVTLGEGDRRDPNVRATTQELYDGLVARGQNAWPNVRRDMGAVSGLFSRFFAAGFYYKTFMGWPPFEWGRGTAMWMRYEALIRRAAGLGRGLARAGPGSLRARPRLLRPAGGRLRSGRSERGTGGGRGRPGRGPGRAGRRARRRFPEPGGRRRRSPARRAGGRPGGRRRPGDDQNHRLRSLRPRRRRPAGAGDRPSG